MKRYELTTAPAPRPSPRPRHRINKAQNSLYWKEWAKARAALLGTGLSRTEADAARHELHEAALGTDKSHTDFSNHDLDRVLGKFRAVSKPDDLNAQLQAINGPLNRLINGIAALDRANPGYLPKILEDCAYSSDWRDLKDVKELTKLRSTLARRIERKKSNKEAAEPERSEDPSDEAARQHAEPAGQGTGRSGNAMASSAEFPF